MKTSVITYILLYLTFSVSYSQEIDSDKIKLTGNLLADSKIVLNEYVDASPVLSLDEGKSTKSPVLAGIMSAIIPGSGEFYVGEYLKAAIFFVVEAGLITTAVIYDNKGDNQTIEFQNFADQHWSVVAYAQYLLDHKTELGIPDGCEIPINANTDLPSWQRIENWNLLNECESVFSHHLPRHGTQQYYELIGKYTQYSSGWDEFDPSGGFRNVPQIMRDYSAMRGDANDMYNIAAKAVIGIYINHILSAVDAVWSATTYNKDIAIKMRVENIHLADRYEMIPTLNVQYNF